jgi:hypothetical protein
MNEDTYAAARESGVGERDFTFGASGLALMALIAIVFAIVS